MHVLAAIIGILAALGVWYWRLQLAAKGADAVVDAAGKARGAYNRRKFKAKTEKSVLGDVEDPRVAAAVFLTALGAERGELTEKTEGLIAAMLSDRTHLQGVALEEAMSFALWASGQIKDSSEVVRRFAPLWRESLNTDEQAELLAMATAVAESDGAPEPHQDALVKRLSASLLN